ncbi:hypothetical protein ABR737_01375 [Streptomyces sp. Edi2]|uniref:hypothetical protein n=1 Tax=Streptomyces sp. Edi2 TaxID=3162528 RepID=UPI00330687DE
MDNFTITDDDGFDALLDASSLGAHHVTSIHLPMPELVRQRFRHAAHHPEAYGEIGLTALAAPRRSESAPEHAGALQRGSAIAANEG